jgi:hypothetical protein
MISTFERGLNMFKSDEKMARMDPNRQMEVQD